MSVKYTAQKISDNHWVLPKIGDMKCEAHAFLSQRLFDASEEAMWNQIMQSASYEGVIGAYLLPDCHLGYGIPVGGVVVTEDTMIQSGSGYDISCFTADTKVSLVDGRELAFSELVEEYGSEGGKCFYVYSMTPEGKVTAGRAHSPRKTRKNAELVEIELDNGKLVTCTPNHEWMLRDGTFCKAIDLSPGESLMPLYRSYKKEYCDIQHPFDNSIERMYKVAFREINGYIPKWPQVIHHDIFDDKNPNQTKLNDDPRFLVEMDQNDHFKLYSEMARERLDRGEIWGAKAHKLYPEMYSKMASENMKKLHADPEFQKRHAKRMSDTQRKCQEAGKYDENWAKAGERGRESLIAFNKSKRGREQSRKNGLANKGFKHSEETRKKLREAHAKSNKEIIECPHCGWKCKGKGGYGRHLYWKHNNHKVVSVRKITDRQDVYCLTVDKYANFALFAGVFVHNCGVVYLKVPNLNAEDVASHKKRTRWVRNLSKRISLGIGSDRPELMPKFKKKDIDNILRYGAKAIGVSADICERQFIPVPESMDFSKIKKAYDKALPQLGSVGSGNHFIEMQVDEADGSVWVMIHCGSRGYGWQTANEFFKRGAVHRKMNYKERERSWLRIDEELGKEYWAHHNSAANYAVANRHVIVQGVQESLQKVFGEQGEVYYEISHNLVQKETLILPDGTHKKGFVHRKGATRAFPAGHPDLVGTKWETTGHPCLVPGSMISGAAILFPKENAHLSGYSVNHGSGRVLGRGAAKKKLKHKQEFIDNQMATIERKLGGTMIRGIVTNTKKIPLDECGNCYKDLDEVLSVLEDEGIAEVKHRMYPVANLKGI